MCSTMAASLHHCQTLVFTHPQAEEQGSFGLASKDECQQCTLKISSLGMLQ